MKPVVLATVWLLAFAGLQGCTTQRSQHQLDDASRVFQGASEDPQILHDAPKDLMRAAESLERAKRFADYWGSAEDVEHYAYLSTRYSEIARQHSEEMQNQRRATHLAMEHERLRQALQEARLLDLQQQDRWLEDQVINLAAAETDRGLVMTLGDVLFKAASADLGPSANRTLLKVVHFLQLNPSRRVRIEGYTDNRGDATENLALSEARAQAVADFMQSLGVDARRIEVIGYGEQFRIAENASARGRAQNRRVEILFSDEQGRLSSPR
ncbi:OmpA family protein [Stutzerimonas stutzeri]|uniref:OmpA family protein n=1 Tax=Stutzerimonas stutzeri TaxID=316 RepID=A0A6I6LML9_STUST|nr:OmpA family protein [Stutzerimonas stutzeri]QGZ30473.1 OmpA family protein [Stutzerimonas stutzeri]